MNVQYSVFPVKTKSLSDCLRAVALSTLITLFLQLRRNKCSTTSILLLGGRRCYCLVKWEG